MSKEVIFTAEGLKRMEEELNFLKTVRRKQVADRIRAARQFGDISENSEYDEAKNEQAFVEGRILLLEKMLRNARVVSADCDHPEEARLGCRVKLRELDSGSVAEYVLVGPVEADPARNRISNESPLGKAVLGHRRGETVEVKAPIGVFRYEIVEVSAR